MIHEQLEDYLSSLEFQGEFVLVETLKTSQYEITEIVKRDGRCSSENNLYIRKRILSYKGSISAYQLLHDAQNTGHTFIHLPHIYDCFASGEELVVIMEYVRGKTIDELIFENNGSPELAYNLFPQICEAVEELHTSFSKPIIHRDLKPSNIILTKDSSLNDRLLLLDFGISRLYQDGAERDTKPFGTKSYAAPEQYGFCQTDVRSDIYSLGMLLYFMITEKLPSPSLSGTTFQDPAIPTSIRPILAKATAFDPKKRHGSVRELNNAFKSAIPKSSSQYEKHPSLRKSLCVWNIVVAFSWFIFFAATVSVAFELSPSDTLRDVPIFGRILIYSGVNIMTSGVAWALLAKPALPKRLNIKQSYIKGFLVGAAIFIVGFVYTGIAAVLLDILYGI